MGNFQNERAQSCWDWRNGYHLELTKHKKTPIWMCVRTTIYSWNHKHDTFLYFGLSRLWLPAKQLKEFPPPALVLLVVQPLLLHLLLGVVRGRGFTPSTSPVERTIEFNRKYFYLDLHCIFLHLLLFFFLSPSTFFYKIYFSNSATHISPFLLPLYMHILISYWSKSIFPPPPPLSLYKI